ncbi:MAG: hypothetical protein ACXVPQ_03375 [Bacteroidia bacterium]
MKRWFLYVPILACCYSCKKNTENTPPQQQQTQVQVRVDYSDSLAPYKFKTGTTWIYQKAASTVTDQVTVANTFSWSCNTSPCSVHGISSPTCTTYYSYGMEFHSLYYGESSNIFLHTNCVTSLGDWCQSFPLLEMPYNASDTIYTKLYQLATSQTLTIGTHTFAPVTKVKCTNQAAGAVFHSPYGSNCVLLYFCPNIGIVRKEIETSPGVFENWDLMSYTIVQ